MTLILDSLEPTNASERRDAVVRATCTVIARDGLDRASLRAIAYEMKCTTGVLTHYFRNKDELLQFTFDAIVERINGGADLTRETRPTIEQLKGWLEEFLPNDAESRMWWKVWLSFTLTALTHPQQNRNHAALYTQLRDIWAGILTKLQAQSILRADMDIDLEADTLLFLTDGICIQALLSPDALPRARQVEILSNHLDRLSIQT